MPRIAALLDDLNRGVGAAPWKQLADRVAVTFQNVPEYSTSNANSFQIEMFFDGRIRITCLGIAATDGLIGLSPGLQRCNRLLRRERFVSAYATSSSSTKPFMTRGMRL